MTSTRPTHPTTITELLDARAAGPLHEPAYTFLVDGERDERTLTFAELAARARQVAAAMLEEGQPGGRALLLYPPGLDFLVGFFACLYARVIAVPAYPPHRPAELRRLEAIVGDARPSYVLSTAALMEPIRRGFAQHGAAERTSWIASDAVATRPELPPFAIAAGDLAFLQYTSGSTGSPRGVMLSHANLLHNAGLVHAAIEHQAGDRYVSWLPTFHDMGFMAGVLEPLYAGLTCVQMSPQAFLERPVRWLQAISRHRGTTSGGPNFAYELCLHKVTDEELAALDLSSWTVAFSGAEPVRSDTLHRFAARFAPAGLRAGALYPCYGLAEATLMVTGSFKGRPAPVLHLDPEDLAGGRVVTIDGEGGKALVACGRSLAGQEIAIVDPDSSRECEPDRVGEIWVRGDSVAAGYWDRPEETAATFGARIAGSDRGQFLRTGDLGFTRGGQLYIAGRLKDLLILRGRNHYPQDIERTVERCHPALRPGCAAVFSVEIDGEERLVVVSEVRAGREDEADAILLAIRRAIADEHELVPRAVALVAKGSIHKTSSGKIQRRSCKRAFLSAELAQVASWTGGARPGHGRGDSDRPAAAPNQISAWLIGEVARRAHVAPASIDPAQPLAAYGLDSLSAIELAHAIQLRFEVEVPISDLLGGLTVSDAARRIAPMNAAAPASATGALSRGQRALWLLKQLQPDSTAHTIARALRVRAGADRDRLRRAFEQLVRRHSSLRTRFPLVHGEPVREELADDPRVFRAIPSASFSAAELERAIEQEASAPFDLAEGPVLRVRLFERGVADSVLLIAVHHIAADLWSLVVLLRELGAICTATGLDVPLRDEPGAVGHDDFVAWQDELLRGEEGARLRAHWKKTLAGDHAPLELPADQVRTRSCPPPSATCGFAVDRETTDALRRLGAQRGATLFGTTLAAWQLLLHRLTGQDEITVGTPTSGRGRAELAGLVAYLVNVVPVAAAFERPLRFTQLVERVNAAALTALAHAALPFPDIVAASAARESGAPALVRSLFAFQRAQSDDSDALTRLALGLPGARLTVGELDLESLAAPSRTAEFDLSLSMGEADGGLVGALEYRSDLFARETIAAWLDCLQTLLHAVAAQPDAIVDEVPLLSDRARQHLDGFERGDQAESPARALHEQFEERVAAAPNRTALMTTSEHHSRAELDREANRIAHHLRTLGVGTDDRVAIFMSRTPRMVAAMLATWKCGAAYVPIDPAYPAERVRFLLQDAAAVAVITDRACRSGVEGSGPALVCLDRDAAAIAARPATSPGVWVGPERAAYVIYTSGSTGLPKGVVIEHRQASALVAWAERAFTAEERSAVLAATSVCFDLSIFEIWVPLCTGGAIVLADSLLDWWMAAQDGGSAPSAATINTVPSALAAALEAGPLPAGVSTVNLAGEALEPALVDALFREAPASTRLVNLYAPSETTTYSTFTDVRPGQRVTIGRPLGAATAQVVDAREERVPVGVTGELLIGGPGVARGYWRRPGLTAERFLPDPAGRPGARLYRTGDRVRWRADRRLEFLGRQDDQVKVRGFRIELGEIASALGEHPAVLECVAAVRGAGPHARVVAYVVARAGHAVEPDQLVRHLQDRLPRSMVPSPIAILDRLPRSRSGKVDRAALPEPGPALPAPRRPPTEIEAAVAAVWAEALGVAQVGVDDDLFALGAHSLLAITVLARLQTRLGVSLTLRQMFDAPTVAAIAAAIQASGSDPAPTIRRVARGRRGAGGTGAATGELDAPPTDRGSRHE